MKDWFGTVSAYGQEVRISRGGTSRAARAFIQAVSVTDPERAAATPAGLRDERRYLIIAGPGAFKIEGEGPVTIQCGSRSYEVLRFEELGGGSHCEAIMRIKAGERDA